MAVLFPQLMFDQCRFMFVAKCVKPEGIQTLPPFSLPLPRSFLSVSVSGRLASPCGRSPRGVRLRTPGWKTVRFMITWDKETVSNSLQTVWTACECPHSSQNTHSLVFYFMKYLFSALQGAQIMFKCLKYCVWFMQPSCYCTMFPLQFLNNFLAKENPIIIMFIIRV